MVRLLNLTKRAVRELRKNGLSRFVRKTVFYVFGSGKNLWAVDKDDWERKKARNIFGRFQVPHRSGKKQKIVFVLPGLWIAGGIAVILRHANLLKKRGYDVKIVTQDLEMAAPWFEHQQVDIVPISKIGDLVREGIDILVATGWNSVPTVDLLPARRKLYFVQLDERRFYSDTVLQAWVGETYRVDFEYVTMARFLQEWLKQEFGHEANYVPNGLDTERFKPVEPLAKKTERIRVLIEGPINIPFKGVAEAYAVLRDLDVDIWIVSGNGVPPKEWRYEKFFERVPLHDMPRLYSSCDILLKMSTVESFCYPPLEMMACGGVPVILEVSGIEEYARHDVNCLIVRNKEEALQAVRRLMRDKELYLRLRQAGLETVQQWGWSRSTDALEKIIIGESCHEERFSVEKR